MSPEKKRLTRSSSDKMVAGVLGGIAEHYNLNITWLRIGVLFAFLCTAGTVFLAYLAAVIIMPSDG
ncbi:MAG: PspC domain-containing protein [Rhodothermaceae bacterium]|nr:PspC domain-containing protein [Rhodothermaceae bacterium]MXZ58644.1 PspC domain-containing protein [Rhodothermaceae bacterium]MYB90994.1 PspC domain-containing protein [Rhodothermaceae bacterium]MYD66957.1 PspC domain-containing protein [Rhodothermaceae bacterium]MYG44789.1 PspC domain-containing protein [Rhodothermaceae bacterium]